MRDWSDDSKPEKKALVNDDLSGLAPMVDRACRKCWAKRGLPEYVSFQKAAGEKKPPVPIPEAEEPDAEPRTEKLANNSKRNKK